MDRRRRMDPDILHYRSPVYHFPTRSLHARRNPRRGAVNQGDTGGDGDQAEHFAQPERFTQQEGRQGKSGDGGQEIIGADRTRLTALQEPEPAPRGTNAYDQDQIETVSYTHLR